MRALVIADDFTGAAEIAGIGHRFGLQTRVLRRPPTRIEPGLTVVDTDSRLLTPDAAAHAASRSVELIHAEAFELVYKKTDSVLRGPVAAELDALAAALRKSSVLFVPQNPSRGRVIIDGEYRIDGMPLHTTSFANDPTHPARSSNAAALLGPHSGRVKIGDGASAADLAGWAMRLTPATLPAGGADFFTAILAHRGLTTSRPPAHLPTAPRLFVCGSTQPCPLIWGAVVRPMMDSSDAWCDAIITALADGQDVMMTVDRPLDTNPGAAGRIELHVTSVAAAVLRRAAVPTVLATGGATAAALCNVMAWVEFAVKGELAPGVVQLRPANATATSLVVKPGSYAWPPQFDTLSPGGLGGGRRGL